MGHQEDIVKTESKIMIIRDTQVILDRDVAELYGVETREINQALRNNPKKFPPGYVIELNNREKDELIKNFDRFNKIKHSTVAPHAFTEQGLYMLATILKGDLAISTTIAIIDTFTKLRKLAEIGDLRKFSREELELYDEDIKNMRDIYASGNGHRASTGGNSEIKGTSLKYLGRRKAALDKLKASFLCARLHFLCTE